MRESKALKSMLISLILLSMCVIMSGCFGKKEEKISYDTAIGYYFEGMEKANYDTYKKAFPDFLTDDLEVDENKLQASLEKMKYSYGDDVKITFDVANEKDLSEDDLSTVEKYIEMKYDKKINISEGKQIEVTENITGSKRKDSPKRTFRVYKINGEWKIIGESISSMKTKIQRNQNNNN